MLIDPPGSYVTYYNFELNPGWEPAITAADYREDQDPYPRKPEYVPTWWDGRDPDYGDRDDVVTRMIGGMLRFDLPAAAARVRITAEAGQPATARIHTVNGADRPWTPPPILDEFLRHHRDAGAPWRSVTLEYEHRGEIEIAVTG